MILGISIGRVLFWKTRDGRGNGGTIYLQTKKINDIVFPHMYDRGK